LFSGVRFFLIGQELFFRFCFDMSAIFDPVHLRFNKSWYEHHHTSCFRKAAAFTVGAALNAAPFVFLFHVRKFFSGHSVCVKSALVKTFFDTGSASMVAGMFVGSYCAINNFFGHAYVSTAAASAGLAASCFGLTSPKSLPYLIMGGVTLAVVVWTTTPILQLLAEEKDNKCSTKV
jgi:hypothetical protein